MNAFIHSFITRLHATSGETNLETWIVLDITCPRLQDGHHEITLFSVENVCVAVLDEYMQHAPSSYDCKRCAEVQVGLVD